MTPITFVTAAGEIAAVLRSKLPTIPVVEKGHGKPDPKNEVSGHISSTSGAPGVCILVEPPISLTAIQTRDAATITVNVEVILYVNKAQNENAGNGGLNLDPMEIISRICSAVLSLQPNSPSRPEMSTEPFIGSVEVTGAKIYPLRFQLTSVFVA